MSAVHLQRHVDVAYLSSGQVCKQCSKVTKQGWHINMQAMGAQVHFSWLPCLRFSLFSQAHPTIFAPIASATYFTSSCLTHITSVIPPAHFVSSHLSRIAHFGSSPSHPFRVITLVAVSPVLDHRRLTHFGSPPSHPFRVVTYRRFWIVTLLWQIRWATWKLLSDALVTCFLLSEMGTSRRQSRRASLLR